MFRSLITHTAHQQIQLTLPSTRGMTSETFVSSLLYPSRYQKRSINGFHSKFTLLNSTATVFPVHEPMWPSGKTIRSHRRSSGKMGILGISFHLLHTCTYEATVGGKSVWCIYSAKVIKSIVQRRCYTIIRTRRFSRESTWNNVLRVMEKSRRWEWRSYAKFGAHYVCLASSCWCVENLLDRCWLCY